MATEQSYPTNLTRGCLRILGGQFFPIYPVDNIVSSSEGELGLGIDIINIIARKHNFCFQVVSKTIKFGLALPNGTWTGIRGKLAGQFADMNSAALMTTDNKCCDISYPIAFDKMTIFFKRPEVQPDIAGFVRPFSGTTWAAMFFGIFLVSILFTLIHNASTHKRTRRHWKEKTTSRLSLMNALFWSFGQFVSQNVAFQPQGTPMKTLQAFWILMVLLLSLIYKAVLKSHLISPLVQLPFNSFEDFAEKSSISLWVQKGGILHDGIVNSVEGTVLHSLIPLHHSELIDSPEWINDTEDGKIAVGATNGIFMEVMQNNFIQTGKCNFMVTERGLFYRGRSFMFQRNSPLTPIFKRRLLQLHEGGILMHIFDLYEGKASLCLRSFRSSFHDVRRPLQLQDFYGTLALLLAGLVAGLIVFVFEVCLP